MEQRQRIITYRFGELGSMARIHNSMRWIAQKMGVIYSTVVRIIAQYKAHGGVIVYRTATRDRGRQNFKLTEEQERELCSKRLLWQWRNFTLEKRCTRI